MKPLFGHTDQQTAYMIEDYPYGRLRCRRRVWLESNPKHGFRLVSQTEHPTRKVWNKPHTSTYIDIAAGMYLDDNGHVTWTGIGIYTDAQEALEFAKTFGAKCSGAARLVDWAGRKARLALKFSTGEANVGMTVNGVDRTQPRDETQRAKDLEESKTWAEVASILKSQLIETRKEDSV